MISVCLTTYNGSKYIKEQIISILIQLGECDELIISDDCSTDETIAVINSINDHRIKIYYNKSNLGYTRNFEKALSLANGDFIFLADQDDVWCQNKVKLILSHLNNCDFVVSDAVLIDEKGNLICNSFYSLRHPYRSRIGNILKFGYLGCCMAFKKEILLKAMPFPRNNKLCTHDNWLFLIGCFFFNYRVLDDKLILYRRHANNISNGGLKNSTSFLYKLLYRLYLVCQLIIRKIR